MTICRKRNDTNGDLKDLYLLNTSNLHNDLFSNLRIYETAEISQHFCTARRLYLVQESGPLRRIDMFIIMNMKHAISLRLLNLSWLLILLYAGIKTILK